MSKNPVTVFETELQNRIAELHQAGYDPYTIATMCECQNSHVYYVINSSKYAELRYTEARKKLITEGYPAAIQVLIEIIMDKTASKSARARAASIILQETGCVVSDRGNLEKSPASMTLSELQDRLKQLQSEAANRSQAAVIEGSATNLDDILD